MANADEVTDPQAIAPTKINPIAQRQARVTITIL